MLCQPTWAEYQLNGGYRESPPPGSIDICFLLPRRRNAPSSSRSMTESRSISVALSPMTKAGDSCEDVMRYVTDRSPEVN
jgi:hypothetical protein